MISDIRFFGIIVVMLQARKYAERCADSREIFFAGCFVVLLFSIFYFLFSFSARVVFGAELNVTVTGYTSRRGVRTATGTTPKFGTIAASRDLLRGLLSHGTCLEIPGVYPGRIFRVEDTMGSAWTNKIDIWVGSREEAVHKIGRRKNVAVKSVLCSSGSGESSADAKALADRSEGAASESGALYDPEHNAWIPLPTSLSCSFADINRDGQVDIVDLVLVARWFGNTVVPGAKEDINEDGKVDIVDLVLVAREFGDGCSMTDANLRMNANLRISSELTNMRERATFASVLKSIFWVGVS